MSFKLFHKPIKTTNITSPFGWRIHPITGVRTMHNGIDLSDGRDRDNIYAVAPGKIITAGYNASAGNNIRIDHGNGVITWYMHLNDLLVKVGDQVQAGTIIGHEGTTGGSTGDHLHFQININGTAVDPLPYLKEIWANPTPTPPVEVPKKSNEEIAQDIIDGKGGWGNDPARSRALTAAGYDPAAIQKIVNKILAEQNKPAEPAPEPVPPTPAPVPSDPTPATIGAGVKVVLNNPVDFSDQVLDRWTEGARFITIEKSVDDGHLAGTVAISPNGKNPATARVSLKDISVVNA